jgi:alpha-mannosidase
VDFDLDDPAAPNMIVIDGDGKAVPHQVLADLGEQTWMEVNKANHKRRLRIAIQADVPGCGYRVYFVRGTSEAQVARRSQPMNLPTSVSAANEFHRLTIAGDGTLEIEDLQSGARYTGLHYFEDVEDAGDSYSYAPCAQSQTLSTRGKPARIELLRHGPCITTWRVEQGLALPLGLSPDRQQRSAKTVDTPIVSEISLYAGQPGVYIVTEIDNRARDHKLSVVFPTWMNPAAAVVDESFTTVARSVDLPPAPGWVEDPTPLMHQRAFTDLSEGKQGLAVLNRGLPSVEVRRAEGGTQISLQLLRATGWLSRGDLSTRRVVAGPMVESPEAQCLGRQRFEYAILPHAGEWEAVYPLAYSYVTPLLLERADTFEGDDLREMNMTGGDPAKAIPLPWRRAGPLPDVLSFLAVEPQALVLSAVRRTADGLGLVVRAYNISLEAVNGRITCWKPLSEAWRTNLNEERQSPLAVKDEKTVGLPVKSGEVVTVELRF